MFSLTLDGFLIALPLLLIVYPTMLQVVFSTRCLNGLSKLSTIRGV